MRSLRYLTTHSRINIHSSRNADCSDLNSNFCRSCERISSGKVLIDWMYQSKLAGRAHCKISTSPHYHPVLTNDPSQFDTSCPKTNTIDSSGDCPINNGMETCSAYCEAKIQWSYGQEVPFSGTECAANSSCTFSNAQTISITNTWTFEGGINLGGSDDDLEAAFNLGASYSYAITKSTTQTLTQPRPPLTLTYCGYWTFLSFYIQYVIHYQLRTTLAHI